MNPDLTKNFISGAAISSRRFVKHGASDDIAIQAAATSDAIMGVSDELGALTANESLDVYHTGSVEIEYGAIIARGQLLTSDANGKAIVATSGNRIAGIAMVSGVPGDIGDVLLSPGIA